jgi:histidinol dehydrogenase
VHGAVILVEQLDEAPALVDRIAPEHLEIATEAPEELADRVRHSGAIFLGRHTPEAVGDYVAGPNHVLPTFMKRSSLIGCTPEALAAIGPAAVTLARAEGLDAHALSLTLRLEDDG